MKQNNISEYEPNKQHYRYRLRIMPVMLIAFSKENPIDIILGPSSRY